MLLLLYSCRSINSSREETGVPPSTVILSFDDGPNANDDTTARLLDVLSKYRIKAMFALLGENAEANPELVRRIHNEGHIIINHGYSGKWSGRMSKDAFRNNLVSGEAAISAALGMELHPKLYRPHGGFFNSAQEKICRAAGYTIVPANVRIYDAVLSGAEKEKAVKKILKAVEKQNGGIVLLHDARDSHYQMEKKLEKKPDGVFNRSWLPETVEEIITALLDKGFSFN